MLVEDLIKELEKYGPKTPICRIHEHYYEGKIIPRNYPLYLQSTIPSFDMDTGKVTLNLDFEPFDLEEQHRRALPSDHVSKDRIPLTTAVCLRACKKTDGFSLICFFAPQRKLISCLLFLMFKVVSL